MTTENYEEEAMMIPISIISILIDSVCIARSVYICVIVYN